jgi:hypothetical protein
VRPQKRGSRQRPLSEVTVDSSTSDKKCHEWGRPIELAVNDVEVVLASHLGGMDALGGVSPLGESCLARRPRLLLPCPSASEVVVIFAECDTRTRCSAKHRSSPIMGRLQMPGGG